MIDVSPQFLGVSYSPSQWPKSMAAYKWGIHTSPGMILPHLQADREAMAWNLLVRCLEQVPKNLLPNGGEQRWFSWADPWKLYQKTNPRWERERWFISTKPFMGDLVLLILELLFFLAPPRSPQHLNPFIPWKKLKYGNRFAHISCKGPSSIKHQNLGGP